MTRRDFVGVEFYAWLQATYDDLRAGLKRPGPQPNVELLRLDRDYAATLKRMLDA